MTSWFFWEKLHQRKWWVLSVNRNVKRFHNSYGSNSTNSTERWKHNGNKSTWHPGFWKTMMVTAQMTVGLWVTAHEWGTYHPEAHVLSREPFSGCVKCGRKTHWALSWLCFWLLIGGSAVLLLNSSPFLRVSRICSVSVFKLKKKKK